MKKLLKLFLSTFYLSAFTFGGGYVIISLMKKKFVNSLLRRPVLTLSKMLTLSMRCVGSIK